MPLDDKLYDLVTVVLPLRNTCAGACLTFKDILRNRPTLAKWFVFRVC